jgi:hypothetical protein
MMIRKILMSVFIGCAATICITAFAKDALWGALLTGWISGVFLFCTDFGKGK